MQYSQRAREGSPSDEAAMLKKERGRLVETVDRLAAEMEEQEKRVARVHATLRAEKDSWLQVWDALPSACRAFCCLHQPASTTTSRCEHPA